MNRLSHSQRYLSLPLAISMVALLYAGAPCASASTGIEGVWTFNGGAVDIVGQPNGTLAGVVTMQTKFAECFHPVNEKMWTEMRAQTDGSYWGLHQWYFEPSAEAPGCTPNPSLGPSVWRILSNSKGESFLRVCFSSPGSSSQPTIAPSGSSAHVTYGCADSASIAPLPVVSGKEGASRPRRGEISFSQVVALPSAHRCVRSRKLKIVLHNAKYDPFKEIVVRVNGKKVVDVRGVKKLKKAIVLRHLPNGSYTVRVLGITVLDQRLSGGRHYRSCTKGSGRIKLHQVAHNPRK